MFFQKPLYFTIKASEFITCDLDNIWFIGSTKHLQLNLKVSINQQILRQRNLLILISMILLICNLLRIIVLSSIRFILLLIPRIIDGLFNLIGLWGNLRLNLYCQFVALIISYLIELAFCILFYLQYNKTNDLLESCIIFGIQLIDIIFLFPRTIYFWKIFKWYEESMNKKFDPFQQNYSQNIPQNQIEEQKTLDKGLELSKVEDFTLEDTSQQNQNFRQNESYQLCVICSISEKNSVFYKCGHSCCCLDCAKHLKSRDRCPICRAEIKDVVRIYSS